MIITSGKVIVWTGLAALALVACGGTGTVDGGDPTLTESNTAGGGGGEANGTGGTDGSAGQGGAIEVKDVEPFSPCNNETMDATIGHIYDEDQIMHYDPSEVTLGVGSVVLFHQVTDVQATISGVYPDADGKFASEVGGALCLIFNAVGTYPFWTYDHHLVTGTVYIQ